MTHKKKPAADSGGKVSTPTRRRDQDLHGSSSIAHGFTSSLNAQIERLFVSSQAIGRCEEGARAIARGECLALSKIEHDFAFFAFFFFFFHPCLLNRNDRSIRRIFEQRSTTLREPDERICLKTKHMGMNK